MRRTLRKFLVDRITITPAATENVEGSTMGGTPRTAVPAKVTYTTKRVVGANGDEVVSSAQVHLPGDDPIDLLATVTLPDGTVARKVLMIEAPSDWQGTGERHHKKVYL